jgi:hypothetical protein
MELKKKRSLELMGGGREVYCHGDVTRSVHEREERRKTSAPSQLGGSATWAKKKMRPKENRRKKKKDVTVG